MAWVEPFVLDYWIRNVFSGSGMVFLAVALLSIMAMVAYFRMAVLMGVMMLALFFIMLNDYIVDQSFYFLLISIGALLVGYWASKIVKN